MTSPSDRALKSGSSQVSLRGLAAGMSPALRIVVLLVGVVFAADLARRGLGEEWLGFDLRGTLWDPAIAIREGRNPYPPAEQSAVDVGNPALYPPLLMLLVLPLTFLPWWLGLTAWLVVLGGAMALSLYALDVRDLRCYAAVLVSAPVVTGLLWANAALLLVLPVALAWRWRTRAVRTGVLVGLAIAMKLFLWPLVFWLLGTRRWRAAAWAIAATCALLVVPWATIGFAGFIAYPDLLRVAEDVFAGHSYSVVTMLSALGASTDLGTYVAFVLGAALAGCAFVAGRRGRDELAISLAVVAAILGSPIVWEYYYVLLFVPIAIVWPRFSWPWLIPLALWLTHRLPRPRLLSTDLEPGGSACCRPDDVPMASWVFNHAPPGLWPAVGHALVALAVVAAVALTTRASRDLYRAPR